MKFKCINCHRELDYKFECICQRDKIMWDKYERKKQKIECRKDLK